MATSQAQIPRRAVMASVLTAGAGLWVLVSGVSDLLQAPRLDALLPLVLAAVLMNLLAVRLPRGDAIVLDGAVVVAALLIFGGAAAVVTSFMGGLFGSVILRGHSWGRLENALDLSRRVIAVWLSSFAGAALAPLGGLGHGATSILAALLVGLVYMSLDLVSLGAVLAARERLRLLAATESVARSVFFLYLGQVSLGVVLAVVYEDMGILAVGILGVLAMILLNAFSMYLKTKMMYQQTIHALSRASSLQASGPSPDARLVADLSVAVARRLGLRGSMLETVSYAALLRDIGRIAAHAAESEDEKHAIAGASLVEGIPFLAGTGTMIRNHHRAFTELQSLDRDQVTGATAIHLCADFLDRASGRGEIGSASARVAIAEGMLGMESEVYGEQAIRALLEELKGDATAHRFEWGTARPC